MKMIKWARKQGACLIKVNGVELTFPLDAPGITLGAQEKHREVMHSAANVFNRDIETENELGAKALRNALASDALNQIEDQEKWFHNNRPPEI